jgi:beta-lactamase superfamily II metal-dependent hydrolase
MIVYYKKTRGTLKSADDTRSQAVLWGDWLDVEETLPPSNEFVVRWHRWNSATGRRWIEKFLVRKADTQRNPLLEMIFLDIGQGDGCLVSLPDATGHKHLIIDAGEGDNMLRFLRWKTRGFATGTQFDAAVITHSDMDHYKGFQGIFNQAELSFANVYHNGLVERAAADDLDILGPRAGGFCTEVIPDRQGLHQLLSPTSNRGRKLYPKLLWTALSDTVRFGNISMASTLTGEEKDGKTFLPGFAPSGDKATIEILGPVPMRENGRLKLKAFGKAPNDGTFNVGKTKNGHSVILRLELGNFRAVFGGDLNRPAEDYLLRHYGGISTERPLAEAVPAASARFAADLLKCCHHGSADVTDEFLAAVNPFAFVVSSGDEESHVHPRPEILGLLGKHGRGDRPLILCTEILRSTPESKLLTDEEKKRIEGLMADIEAATTEKARNTARKAVADFWERRFRRLVNVYGAINIRTDGHKLIVAFKKEVAGKAGAPWQVYQFAFTAGEWQGEELEPR